jgi:two-component system nitrogen regulation sensor histidine kinase GlnL
MPGANSLPPLNENIWPSLPVPALIIGADDMIVETNPAAEQFLNASAKSLRGKPVFDRLAIDAPLEEAFLRVRRDTAPMFINNVDVSGGNAAPVQCNMQIAPLVGTPGAVILLMEPRQIADRLGRALSVAWLKCSPMRSKIRSLGSLARRNCSRWDCRLRIRK